MTELCVYEVKDGKIVSEQFFIWEKKRKIQDPRSK